MRCLLFVGLAIEIYKKPPRIRLYLNDKFIDEILIEKNKNLEYLQKLKKKNKELSDNNTRLDPSIICPLPGGPDHMFVYEVEVPDKNVIIKLTLDNDDNNFTNGFMTKFTSVTLLYLNLIPLQIFSNNKKLLRLKKYVFSRKSNFFVGQAIRTKNYYRNRPVFLYNFVDQQFVKFIAKDHTVKTNVYLWTIGKSGTYFCEIKKKHGVYVNGNKNKSHAYYRFSFDDLKKLFDKYNKNENQRNYN